MADWIYVAYVAYVVTYLTGLTFYIRFDVRRRPLRRRLLGIHLLMAVVTFISLTASMALYGFPERAAVPETSHQSTMWYYVLQHRSEHSKSQIAGQP
ncbi:MAG: hypothetical protein M1499_04515 [Firmicutes bacterium]|nr:hypothetical protein [Bacillota bacterium]